MKPPLKKLRTSVGKAKGLGYAGVGFLSIYDTCLEAITGRWSPFCLFLFPPHDSASTVISAALRADQDFHD